MHQLTNTNWRRWLVLALLLALLGGTLGGLLSAAPRASVRLDWWTSDGGGGTSHSSDGALTLSGTAGQADAGTLTGGDLTLQGGFWAGAAHRYTRFLPLAVR